MASGVMLSKFFEKILELGVHVTRWCYENQTRFDCVDIFPDVVSILLAQHVVPQGEIKSHSRFESMLFGKLGETPRIV